MNIALVTGSSGLIGGESVNFFSEKLKNENIFLNS